MFRKRRLRKWAAEARHAYNEGLRVGACRTHVPKRIPNTHSSEVAFARGVKDASRKVKPVEPREFNNVEIPIDLWQEVLARKEKPPLDEMW